MLELILVVVLVLLVFGGVGAPRLGWWPAGGLIAALIWLLSMRPARVADRRARRIRRPVGGWRWLASSRG